MIGRNTKKKTVNKKRRRDLIIARSMAISMIVLLSMILIHANITQSLEQIGDQMVEKVEDERFEQIYAYLLDLNEKAEANAREVADNIEADITEAGLDTIKADMNNDGTLLHDIFRNNIKSGNDHYLDQAGSSYNGIFIASLEGILEDYSYTRSDGVDVRNWDHEISSAYNKQLAEKAIDKLLQQHNDELICSEPINRIYKSDTDHTIISDASYEDLRRVYMNEGIEGLKNYQFYAPAYITENGDIFGEEDIVNGIRQPNNKIIVVQEFNLYDQLEEHHPRIFEHDKVISIQNKFAVITNAMYISGLAYVVLVIVLLFYFSSVYNNFITVNGLLDEKKSNDEAEGERKTL